MISDHYFPWLEQQGHAPYAWSVLGAAAAVTERIPLMTFVTCPIVRYHPALVAQKAATMALLSDGRFSLGLGAGENLNEHVVGAGWPAADQRHEMLTEAVEIIRELWGGGYVNYRVNTSTSSRPSSTTCRTCHRRWGLRYPASSRAGLPASTPT